MQSGAFFWININIKKVYRSGWSLAIVLKSLPTPSFVSEMHDFEVAPVSS